MPIEIISTIQDSDGDRGTTSIRVGDSATIAGLEGFAQAYADAAEPLLNGAIQRMDAVLHPSPQSLTNNTALAGSDIHRQAKFEFITEEGTRTKINIPALFEAVGQGAGQDSLDQADPDVAAFISMMENGLTVSAGLIRPCDIGEFPIEAVIFAREAHKNSGKRA